MPRKTDLFESVVKDVTLPILTLDNNWHRLFSQQGMSPEMKAAMDALNDLVKEQGRLNSEKKKLKVIKKSLMDEIVLLADKMNDGNMSIQKELDQKRGLLEDCGVKLDEINDALLELPAKIDKANKALMVLSMGVAYDRISSNVSEIKEANAWINSIRAQLKEKLRLKQKKETDTYLLYAYMREYFGKRVFELLDIRFDPEQFKLKIKESGKKESDKKVSEK